MNMTARFNAEGIREVRAELIEARRFRAGAIVTGTAATGTMAVALALAPTNGADLKQFGVAIGMAVVDLLAFKVGSTANMKIRNAEAILKPIARE